MIALWMHARSQWRARRGALLVLAVLVAIGTAATFTAFAGARRTGSVVERFVDTDRTADVIVSTETDTPLDLFERIDRLDGVEESSVIAPVAAFPEGSSGYVPFNASVDGSAGFSLQRGLVVAGRRADPTAPHEANLSEGHAKLLDKRVGDTIVLRTFTRAEEDRCVFADDQAPDCDAVFASPGGPKIEVLVVGVVRTAIDLRNRADEISLSFLTPAFYEAHRDITHPAVLLVRLSDPNASDAFLDAAHTIAPELLFETTNASPVRDAVSVLTIGLIVFGLVAMLAATVVVGQAVLRHATAAADDHTVLRAFGATRWMRLADTVVSLAPALLAGVVGGGLLAYLASGFMPIGIAGRAEPDPGRQFDGLVIGLGALAVTIGIAALAVLCGWLVDRRMTAPRRAPRPARWHLPVGNRPARDVGVRHALASGSGTPPARTAIIAIATATAGVIAVVGFSSALRHLVETPAMYGWSFDAVGVDPEHLDAVRDDPDVTAAGEATAQLSLRIGGGPTVGYALRPLFGELDFPIVRGREPRVPDEVALGADTMREAGVGIGETVQVAGPEDDATMRVVGQAVFLTDEDAYPLADGALVHPEAIATLGAGDSFRSLAMSFRPGAGDAVRARLEALNGDEIGYPAPPSEVEKLEQVERLPQFLALFLVTLGVVAVGHALVVTVRRRRRDFGVLRAVGFRARDVRVAVSWQAIVIAVLGCLIGLPVGVLLARSVWGAVAQSIGVRTVLEVPAAALLGVLPLTVLMAILVSLVPARRAAKLAPTQLLRSE